MEKIEGVLLKDTCIDLQRSETLQRAAKLIDKTMSLSMSIKCVINYSTLWITMNLRPK